MDIVSKSSLDGDERATDLWEAIGLEAQLLELVGDEPGDGPSPTLRALATLARGSAVLVRASNEPELLQQMCDTAVRTGEYALAWYGQAVHDEAHSIVPRARAGRQIEYLDKITVTWGEDPLGQGPTGTCIRTGTTQIRDDLAHDPRYAPWRSQAAGSGLVCSISLPVSVDGVVDGAFMVYAEQHEAFGPIAQALLEELAADIGFGLAKLRDRARLADAMRGSVLLLAAAVESRDPYTAGHQSHVGSLASAIGRTLGLSDSRLHGLHLGAAIHDVGKLAVPIETLNKSGRLTAEDWELLRRHPHTGYSIVRDFPWPWPIAEMVYQHHERMNGSGYPRALRGNEILLEARIIAVADTFEAIGHDRPYRKAPGVEKGFEVIDEGRNSLFDPDVVDAFHAVMAEGFEFTTPVLPELGDTRNLVLTDP